MPSVLLVFNCIFFCCCKHLGLLSLKKLGIVQKKKCMVIDSPNGKVLHWNGSFFKASLACHFGKVCKCYCCGKHVNSFFHLLRHQIKENFIITRKKNCDQVSLEDTYPSNHMFKHNISFQTVS